jgi:hypothetical protein
MEKPEHSRRQNEILPRQKVRSISIPQNIVQPMESIDDSSGIQGDPPLDEDVCNHGDEDSYSRQIETVRQQLGMLIKRIKSNTGDPFESMDRSTYSQLTNLLQQFQSLKASPNAWQDIHGKDRELEENVVQILRSSASSNQGPN